MNLSLAELNNISPCAQCGLDIDRCHPHTVECMNCDGLGIYAQFCLPCFVEHVRDPNNKSCLVEATLYGHAQ